MLFQASAVLPEGWSRMQACLLYDLACARPDTAWAQLNGLGSAAQHPGQLLTLQYYCKWCSTGAVGWPPCRVQGTAEVRHAY